MARFAGHKYTLQINPWGSASHRWELRGPDGGIHFHVTIQKDAKYPPYSGLEIHRCAPAEYQKGDAPHHLDCPVTGGRCWHDGTSLYATETLWPMFSVWLADGDHDSIFRRLEREYDERFYTPECGEAVKP